MTRLRQAMHRLRLFRELRRLPSSRLNGGTGIIRLDAMGDYILFRPFLPVLKERFGRLTFICSEKVLPLAELLDRRHIDSFIAVDTTRFRNDLAYAAELGATIRSQGLERLINPTWSRSAAADIFAYATGAGERIAWNGDTVNQSGLSKRFTNRLYTTVHASTHPFLFEIFRHREFCTLLTGRDPGVPDNDLRSHGQPHALRGLPVFFIGASTTGKRLPIAAAAETTRILLQAWNSPLVLTGGEDVRKDATSIMEAVSDPSVLNAVGRTSFAELIGLIASAPMLVSYDSVAVHIAMACSTPCVALVHGEAYGRFLPYPEKPASHCTCIYPMSLPDLEWKDLAAMYRKSSPLSMADIDMEHVRQAILWFSKSTR